MEMTQEIKKYFEENKYVVIRNFLSQETASLLYNYTKIKTQREDYKYTYHKRAYNEKWDGTWTDSQCPNTYSLYCDPVMESILELGLNSVQNYTGLTLAPQYSYWRFYQKNNILERHIDRESCEISTTLCLGYDVSNVQQDVYPNYNWAMWVKSINGEELPIQLNPGDMIVYRGCEVEHWREPFLGLNHAQVFLHYNDTSGIHNKLYDSRHILGVPKYKLADELI